jgi:hypothetical protein
MRFGEAHYVAGLPQAPDRRPGRNGEDGQYQVAILVKA